MVNPRFKTKRIYLTIGTHKQIQDGRKYTHSQRVVSNAKR